MAKKREFQALASARDIDARFYRQLNTQWLLHKVDALMLLVKDEDGLRDLVRRADGDEEVVTPKFLGSLRAEIHMAEFQQFEALLAFLLCPYQPLPHWLYMTEYKTADIHNACRALLASDIGSFTEGRCGSMAEFIRISVYSAFRDEKRADDWATNLENIVWLLRRLARRYQEAKEYNAYKHGVRVLTGPHRMTIARDSDPENAKVLASTDDSVSYLETREQGGASRLYLTTRHFNPDLSFNHMLIMASLLETVQSTRLARINGEERAEINTFFTLDKEMLLGMDDQFRTSWTM